MLSKAPPSTDVMLDLETLSSSGDAAVISIGCCAFDLLGQLPELDKAGDYLWQRNITFNSALRHGSVSGSTLEWWFQQSRQARLETLRDQVSLERALKDLIKWWPKGAQMWSHATFDAPVIHHAFEAALHKRAPWHYRETKDLRTISHLSGGHHKEDYPDIGVFDHVAYADAWQQAVAAQRMNTRIVTF